MNIKHNRSFFRYSQTQKVGRFLFLERFVNVHECHKTFVDRTEDFCLQGMSDSSHNESEITENKKIYSLATKGVAVRTETHTC